MGTWGTGLYQDDTACEVRDDYVASLKAGLSDSAATKKVLKGKYLRDRQVACAVYFALAETQWQYGRVDVVIKKRALDLIRKGADLDGWQADAPKQVNTRRKVLETLRKRLESKPKARRPVEVKPPKPLQTWSDAKLGTVFLLPLSKTTFAALVLVANIETGYRTKDPVFSVLGWKGGREPTMKELRGRRFVEVPEGAEPDTEMNKEIGFIMDDARANPLEGLVRTELVIPKIRRSGSGAFFTGKERITELVAAGIAGRPAPPTEWDRKFGFLARKKV